MSDEIKWKLYFNNLDSTTANIDKTLAKFLYYYFEYNVKKF